MIEDNSKYKTQEEKNRDFQIWYKKEFGKDINIPKDFIPGLKQYFNKVFYDSFLKHMYEDKNI